ncbi:SDR family NAD(P)-dependent oxidoreductase [Roseovarius rhodophyticola]|uniref:SDR family oxidoreductase n=1 Tax=Roseovarius rhodophyticola TaxID=3080827 RepID=A0ABZ2TM83_9RHOB|nr:SDR family oxidoreductase [Roseovarius sp. W115]MDV2929822.1 SDR family oxidoreductase [Roseovarius sp. W115]
MKTALVTGAARGIGLATTKEFLSKGWHVVMVDRDEEALTSEASQLQDVTEILCDVSVPGQVADIAKKFDHLNALVNNAGVADFGPIEETDLSRWRTVMETNLDGVFMMTQALTPALAAAKGAIVNIASISGLRASTLRVAYGTSKAGVMALTQQQAVELGEKGIRANCVCPGPVRTKLAMAVHTQDIIDAYHDAIPLNRYGSEDEIANVITFLCSEEASFVTGQIISVDGGFEATGIGLPALRT